MLLGVEVVVDVPALLPVSSEKLTVSAPDVTTTVWSPAVRVVGEYDHVPAAVAVVVSAVPSIVTVTVAFALAVPVRVGFSWVYHHAL